MTVSSTEGDSRCSNHSRGGDIGREVLMLPTKELGFVWWVVRVRERFKAGEELVLLLTPFYR